MRLTDLIRRCRKKISDENKHFFTDVEIAFELNEVQRSLWRQKAAASFSYGQITYDLSTIDNADQIEQVDSDEWIYVLPSWVYRVNQVMRRSGSVSNGLVPLITGNETSGWEFTSNRALLIKGQSTAIDLRLKLQKIPAKMLRGTVMLDSPDLSEIVIPSTLAAEAGETEGFPSDYEDGAMINAQIEVTSSSATNDPRGVVGTVRAQQRLYDVPTAQYQNYLTVLPRYSSFVKALDTFESHAEIHDVDLQLLILETCEGLFHKDHNLAGSNVIRPQLERERVRFTNSLAPRDGNQPHFMETDDDTFSRRDPDRDPTFQ